jgi:hypothetical protein
MATETRTTGIDVVGDMVGARNTRYHQERGDGYQFILPLPGA